ncbi:uncharacterized protein LOC111378409 [Olea europaea var. sylvestris]|uniref:uncharacterized protein LOC111378409 n=1 Tax=Olea europaea var. sylvestris TaxID=158386 RepID=UPI000C1D5D8A|nr:uncharacterized protein LOC111378409 [Olea europaea var. sylvestris]
MISGVLFRRSITLPYLRCLRPLESSQALAEVHKGVCRNHQGASALAFKLGRYGYYWPTMKKDALEYVKRCDRCQSNRVLHKMGRGRTSRHNIEAQAKSLHLEIYHLQSNGLAEVTNRIILQDLRTIIGNARGSWSDELPSILWTYRTTQRTTIGKIPFMLAYGIEVMVPVKIRLPSHRRLVPETSEHTTEHLDLLEEVREQAAIKVASYQTKTAKHFNSKVKTQRFRAGNLVLRRAKAAGHPPGKLGPIWEGPFEAIRQLKMLKISKCICYTSRNSHTWTITQHAIR